MDKFILVNVKNYDNYSRSNYNAFLIDDIFNFSENKNDSWKTTFAHHLFIPYNNILGAVSITKDNYNDFYYSKDYRIRELFMDGLRNYMHFDTFSKKWELKRYSKPNLNILNDIKEKKIKVIYESKNIYEKMNEYFSRSLFVSPENIDSVLFCEKTEEGIPNIKEIIDIICSDSINILVLSPHTNIIKLMAIKDEFYEISNEHKSMLDVYVMVESDFGLKLNLDSQDIELMRRSL